MKLSLRTGFLHLAPGLCAFALLVGPARGQLGVDRELHPNTPAVGALLGTSVAIDAGIAAVGSPFGTGSGALTGEVVLFDAASGTQLLQLHASDGAAHDQFGFAVAIGDGLVVVGAPYDDDNGTHAGSAYVFDAATGAEIVKLLPADGAAGDQFGFSVAVEGTTVAVGANRDDDNGTDSGSVYLFEASNGVELAKLHPNDGGLIATFGDAVDLDQGILAVGSHGDDEKGLLAGAAYLFDVATGAQLAKLVAADGGSNDFFGAAVALDGGVVAVGAWADSIFSDHSGSAYLFDVATKAQITKIVPSDGHDKDHFGNSIAIDGGVVAIGAELDDDTAFDGGSAYLFRAVDGAPLAKILAADGGSHDNFGFSVAIEAGQVVVGAPDHDELGSNAGSAYVVDSGLAEAAERVRVGSPPNPLALLPGVSSGPVLGAVWDPVVDHSTFVPSAVLDVLLVSTIPGPVNLAVPPHGTLLCNVSAFVFEVTSPGTPFSVPLPANGALVGVELCTQAVSLDAGFQLLLTNALDITIGSF